MKTLLKISVVLNLGLAGGLTYVLLNAPKPVSIPVSRVVVESRPTVNERIAAATPNPMPTEPKPFRWNQLDARDYHAYVKNLRDICCPEPTIRAIVTADVHLAISQYGRELEQQLARLAGASWTNQLANLDSERRLKNRLQQWSGEEAAKINDFLGLKSVDGNASVALTGITRPFTGRNPSSAEPLKATTVPINEATISEPEPNADSAAAGALAQAASPSQSLGSNLLPPPQKPVSLPLVYQPVDPAAMNLTESQAQVVNNLRQEFVNNIGGTNQNPDDPAYLQRYLQAQGQSDAMLEVDLGYNVYMQYWVMQYQNSLASQTAAQ